ncbi:MAG: translation initiation factor eIF-1A [Candidatus Heimdallarchaeota archaeon]
MSIKRGKKSKNRTTNKPSNPEEEPEVIRVRLPDRTKGELFGIITRIFGGNHLEVMCEDEKLRITRIPGRFRRRKWLRMGDVVLVEPWYGLDEDKKCDLIYRYSRNQVRFLQQRGMLGEIEQFLEF